MILLAGGGGLTAAGKCPYCGGTLPEQWLSFCPFCGSRFERDDETPRRMPEERQRSAAQASRRSSVQAGCYILAGTGLLILGALVPGITYTTKAGSFTHWPTPVVPVIVLALVIACLGIARLRSASASRSLQVWAALAATAAGCFALPAIERYDVYHVGIGPWVALAGVVVVYLGHSRPRFFWNDPRG